MARLVNLDEYVPEDVDFSYRGETYTLPGDIDVDTSFELLQLFEQGPKLEDATLAKKHEWEKRVQAHLLDLFRARRPDLGALPFGRLALLHVLNEVLILLGLVIVGAGEPDPTGPTPPAKTATRRPSGRRKK